MRVILIGYGAQTNASAMKRIATVTGGRSYASADPRDIDAVLTEALATL